MNGINWKRVLGGGLVAGVVFNVGEFAIEPLMGTQLHDFFDRLGLPVPGEGAMVGLAGLAFALGVITVWFYAAIVPAFGAGARTAIIAAAATWALTCLLPNIVMYAFGIVDTRMFWFVTVWPLAEAVAATLAGARVYGGRAFRAAIAARA